VVFEKGDDIEKLVGAFHRSVDSRNHKSSILREFISTRMTANGARMSANPDGGMKGHGGCES
jgi:hypothetical protein